MTTASKALVLLGVVLTGVLVYLLAPVLTPFLTAAVLAYMGDPLVARLQSRGLSRTQAVALVFSAMLIVLLALLLLLMPMLWRQIQVLIERLPEYLERAQALGPWLEARIGVSLPVFDAENLRRYALAHWQEAGGYVAPLLAMLSRSGLTLIGWLANLLLIPVVTFYLLRDWNVMLARIRELVPRRFETDVLRLARASDEVLGAFLRGQLSVMAILGVIYSAGLMLVGLELGLLIGMIAGLVSFVPYLGFAVGFVAAGIAVLLQFQEWTPLLYVLAVFGVGQLLEGFVLTPWLLGDRIGLHPVAVIFAVLAGGQLFGFVGVLLALPAAAVIMVLLRYAHERYLESHLYGRTDD